MHRMFCKLNYLIGAYVNNIDIFKNAYSVIL